jgi:hypothetical protein
MTPGRFVNTDIKKKNEFPNYNIQYINLNKNEDSTLINKINNIKHHSNSITTNSHNNNITANSFNMNVSNSKSNNYNNQGYNNNPPKLKSDYYVNRFINSNTFSK